MLHIVEAIAGHVTRGTSAGRLALSVLEGAIEEGTRSQGVNG